MGKQWIIILLLTCCCTPVFSQSNNRHSTDNESISVASLYPMQFIFSAFKVGFEQRITNNLSLKGIGSLGLSEQSYVYDVTNYAAFSGEGQVRYYPMHKSPGGFYGGFYFYDRGASFDKEQSLYNTNGYYETVTVAYDLNAMGGGVLLGAQVFAGKLISFDFYAGGGPNIPLTDTPEVDLNNNFGTSLIYMGYRRAITFHGGISIGIILK